MIAAKKKEIKKYEQTLKDAENEQKNAERILNFIEPKYNELIDWAKEFDKMNVSAKRVVIVEQVNKY